MTAPGTAIAFREDHMLTNSRIPRAVLRVALLALLTGPVPGLGACGLFLMPDRDVKERVEPRDLLGEWILTAPSRELLRRDGASIPDSRRGHMELAAGGTCRFSSFRRTPEITRLRSDDCSWSLRHGVKRTSESVIANIVEMEVRFEGVTYSWEMHLDRDERGLILWHFHGDPDLREFMEYVRRDDPRRLTLLR